MKKAVIMAGGFGTRLRPLTMTIPKPMVSVVNLPMMEHIVNLLKEHDITDIVSLLYFQPDEIKNYFEDGNNFGISMEYVQAVADYGTAGSVKNAYKHLNERFIIISGDVLTDFDISKALEFHISKGSKATILLTRVTNPLQYGIVITDDDGKIVRFLEKPSWGQVFSDTINTGIYILEPEVLDLIPYQEDFDFSKDLFPLMLQNQMPLYGYISEGYWRDIGNLEEYQSGQFDALTNIVKVHKQGEKQDNLHLGKNTIVPISTKINGQVMIGDNCKIGENVSLTNCIIGNNVEIGNAAKLTGVTIWNNVSIGDNAQLWDDVICNNTVIGRNVTIAENVFIAANCQIGDDATLRSNIKLWPNKQVQEGAILSRSLVQEEKWTRELFTDARISGLSNIEINPEFCAKVGAAVGMAFGLKKRIIASRDADNVSIIMKRAISAGLLSVGVEVLDLQTTSIPQTRQILNNGQFDGGIHVRKSPRHPDYSDIIIFNKEGKDITIATAKNVERYFFGEDVKRVPYNQVGKITYPERTNDSYIQRILESLDLESIHKLKLRIFMDYSYGLAAGIFPYILGQLNVHTLSTHDFVDATRFHPDPFLQTDHDETGKIMQSLNYDLGFRLESGAEKIALIDKKGVWYPPSRLLSIITKLFLESHKHLPSYKIAVSIVASTEIELIAKEYNVEVVRIKNSHSAMMEATRDESIKFLGGVHGGYIFRDYLFASDGMFTVAQILEMISKTGLVISELDQNLPKRFSHRIDIDCPWDSKGMVMRQIMKYSEEMERQLVEGVKIFEGEDSVLLLPSKEHAQFNIYADASTEDNAKYLASKYRQLLESWLQTR
jgi:mannose-1-phosphate guanylyltransferase/phosphomannomutase